MGVKALNCPIYIGTQSQNMLVHDQVGVERFHFHMQSVGALNLLLSAITGLFLVITIHTGTQSSKCSLIYLHYTRHTCMLFRV